MRPALLALALVALTSTARAQEAPALAPEDARLARLGPNLLTRAKRGVERFLRENDALSRLAPPTSGTFRVGVILIETPDAPRPAFGPAAWKSALFGHDVKKSPSGDPACGSVRDYYHEQSYGALEVEGDVFDWVKLDARRAELETSQLFDLSARRKLFTRAIDLVLARDGARALDRVDALGFVVAGPQAKTRGSVLWPHSSLLLHRGRPWRYYLMHGGDGKKFEPIGTHAHELGHVLGLPDEYGIAPFAGAGVYCCMAIGNYGGKARFLPVEGPAVTPLDALLKEVPGKIKESLEGLRKITGPKRAPAEPAPGLQADGETWLCAAPPPPELQDAARPTHLCAPCKAALGWLEPVALDARANQKIVLEPSEENPRSVVALALDGLGDERLLLEYRGRRGFDAGLPRSGLLAWRTGLLASGLSALAPGANGELLPAHGLRSVDGAFRGADAVMFPWKDKRELVVRGRGLGARTVRVSAIEEKDGRVTFTIHDR